MNKYIKVNRLEFVTTNNCSGKCKHCSIEDTKKNESINTDVAINTINELSKKYQLKSIMTFGGEPLLCTDTVCKIHETAYKNNIENREIITNGYFSKNYEVINKTALKIFESNFNKILLSVDYFHQENIPIEFVIYFAKSLLKHGYTGLKAHPAWLINEQHDNKYNKETKRILNVFKNIGIESSNGNNIIPSGNAIKYFKEYFNKPDTEKLFIACGSMPHSEKLDKINCISINPNGDVKVCSVVIGNIYKNEIIEIVEQYDPYKNEYTKLLVEGGVEKLYKHIAEKGIKIDIENSYSSCNLCYKIMKIININGKCKTSTVYA
jgi:MoaA/NifB/PqqE/SkfB family radical SAM enzyme